MSADPPLDDLHAGYEALRAQAVGTMPIDAPRGRALVLTQGLPAWIGAHVALPVVPKVGPPAGGRSDTGGLGTEVVRLLTEMAIGGRLMLAGAS